MTPNEIFALKVGQLIRFTRGTYDQGVVFWIAQVTSVPILTTEPGQSVGHLVGDILYTTAEGRSYNLLGERLIFYNRSDWPGVELIE